VELSIESLSKESFLTFLENEANIRVDGFLESAIAVAEEVHEGVKREDGISSFLNTHIWPVAKKVTVHYRQNNKPITTVEIASAVLHDVLEDNDRILNLYETRSYGFDAYLRYQFGSRVLNVLHTLKTPSLDSYGSKASSKKGIERERFQDYCAHLEGADYDLKCIKLFDRVNNMKFIEFTASTNKKPVVYTKIKRYLLEAEDFYLAYTMLEPRMPELYTELRGLYEQLRSYYLEQTLSLPQAQRK
jgi:(p)ppGpp synthase/HD superfamily hydrolase